MNKLFLEGEVLMFTLNINGKEEISRIDKPLLSFLRDDLKITSVKDGCSEGACGTCTVLVDGKAVKACVQKVSKFEGKKILTVEGLCPREKEVYEYCFGEAGAVQCGFCNPGMENFQCIHIQYYLKIRPLQNGN
jgi:aerobic-type carbon monoxide dehydrogenase small subunit (CoxS/CutS family)